MTTPYPQPDSPPPDVAQLQAQLDVERQSNLFLRQRARDLEAFTMRLQQRIAELEVTLHTVRGTLDGAKRIISTLLRGATLTEYRAAQAFIRGELTEREQQDIAQAQAVEY